MNNKGSITLEAAIVLPLFIFAMITYVSLIQYYRLNADIQGDITESARELSLYGAASDMAGNMNDMAGSSFMSTVVTDGYAYGKLYGNLYGDNGQAVDMLSHDLTPLNFIFSEADEDRDMIDIAVTYYVSPKINFFGVGDTLLVNRARLHKWSGYSTEGVTDDSDRIVYITETGTVYHLTKTCPYLKLSISMVDYDDLDDLRNSGGEKYKACSSCWPARGGRVYITDYGDRYHDTLSCSGLKRTIKEIYLSEAGDMKACSKCGG